MRKTNNKKEIKMKTLTGHITQTEKSHIKAILDAGIMEGKINRKNYFLSLNAGVYTVMIKENRANDLGILVDRCYKSKFTI